LTGLARHGWAIHIINYKGLVMTNFVETTLKDIEQRLKDLRDEVQKLEAAKSALGGLSEAPARAIRRGRSRASAAVSAAASAAGSAPRRARGGRRPGRPRGSRGSNTRAKQALDLVRNSPGITIPQIAQRLGIEPNYLYRVMPKLVSDGQIRREGQGWHPAGAGSAAGNGGGAAQG
jgi:hypothetical protein